MDEPATYLLCAIGLFIAGQLWNMNAKMAAKEVKDVEQDKDLERLSKRTHAHANTIQGHEGRISTLEQRTS